MSNRPLSGLTGFESAENVVDTLVEKFNGLFANERLLTFKYLRRNLNAEEKKLLDWLLDLKPTDFGLKTPFYGIEEPIEGTHFVAQSYRRTKDDGKAYKVVQYVPLKVYSAFRDMKYSFTNVYPKQDILIASAYRSPAYQSMLIFYYTKQKKYLLPNVLKRVALPGHSEHGLINQTAMDLEDQWDHPENYDDLEFDNTIHFRWLSQNAEKFGFKLSYPQDNPQGIDYEPWHWRYVGN